MDGGDLESVLPECPNVEVTFELGVGVCSYLRILGPRLVEIAPERGFDVLV